MLGDVKLVMWLRREVVEFEVSDQSTISSIQWIQEITVIGARYLRLPSATAEVPESKRDRSTQMETSRTSLSLCSCCNITYYSYNSNVKS